MKPIELMLDLWEDQFVPILTPCSAASFRLKNTRLPKMQRRVGLPRTEIMSLETVVTEKTSPSMANTEHEIALK